MTLLSVAPAAAGFTSSNLVQNSDFETGAFSPWTSWGSATVRVDGAHSGNYGVVAQDSGAGSFPAGVSQSVSLALFETEIAHGDTTISAGGYVCSDGASPVYLVERFYDRWGGHLETRETSVVSSAWTLLVLSNAPPPLAYSLSLEFEVRLDAVIYGSWDDTFLHVHMPSATTSGVTRFVAPGGAHSSPFTNWTAAATTLQAAADAALKGDLVLVSNGVYRGAAGTDSVVSIHKDITVRSVNGPDATIIDGMGTQRCAHLYGLHAVLDGFTLRNGRVHGANATASAAAGTAFGGGAYVGLGRVEHCVIADCEARGGDGFNNNVDVARDGGDAFGGGACLQAFSSSLGWSDIRDSVAMGGDGVGASAIPASRGGYAYGGGVHVSRGTVEYCSIANNAAMGGGGLNVASNGANGGDALGGAVRLSEVSAVLRDSVLSGNMSTGGAGSAATSEGGDGGDAYGGGVSGSGGVVNCTLVENAAIRGYGGAAAVPGADGADLGGGSFQTTARNCLYFGNRQHTNLNDAAGGTTTWSRLSPNPGGAGSFTNNPLFASADFYWLSAASPCRDAGQADADMSNRFDRAGAPRVVGTNTDMGAFEFYGEPGDIEPTNGRPAVAWDVVPGEVYRFLRTTNLITGTWTPAAGAVTAVTGRITMADTNPVAAGFWRLELVP